MKKIVSKIVIIMMLVALCLTQTSAVSMAARKNSRTKMLKKVSSMMKGKYDYYGNQGLYKVRYAVWKKDHFVWYCDGKKSTDTKVYKIKKVNAKKYIFYYRKQAKFRYEASVKNGKIVDLACYEGWTGKNKYSGSSSIYLMSN